jgi:putative ABC transport system substrate-binding protein
MPTILFLSLLTFFLSAPFGPAQAQQLKKLPVVGVLGAASAKNNDRQEAFFQGMRELGYVEGENIVFEKRYAEGKRDRLPALGAELVRLKVDVILAGGQNATSAAKKSTSTIPIVMVQSGDPVAAGLVASLARPGGNVTGLSSLSPELSGKQLEILKEIVPKLSRLAVFHTSTNLGDARTLEETESAAGALGVKLQRIDVRGPKDLETAFRSASGGQAEAILVKVWGAILNLHRVAFAKLAARSRLPAMYSQPTYVEAGGLMTYGVGRKPADLPVEQPTKFEFVVNLKAAKQIGLTIPPNVLARADKVIR